MIVCFLRLNLVVAICFESGKKLMLETEGPNYMAEGKPTKFRDAYEFKTPDLIIATSLMLNEEGKWVTFMTGTMRRKQ